VQYPAPIATDNCLGIGGAFALVTGLPSGVSYPTGTTVNTYSYTDAGGNVGTCSFEVTILSPISIKLDTLINDVGHQGIGSISITASGGQPPYTYTWITNGDTLPVNSGTVTNLDTGMYQVIVTDDLGCPLATQTYTVSNTIDTDEPTWANGLLIVPNPTSGRLSVIFPAQVMEETSLKVYDLTGRMVHQQHAAAPKRIDVDLTHLPAGLYSLLLQLNNQILARKIVVNK
jgi:hypothetical protein